MKNLFSIVMITMLLSISVFGQWTTNYNPEVKSEKSGLELTFTGTLDTAGQTYATLTSNMFSIADFDSKEYISGYYYFNAPAGAPKIYVNWMGSEDNTNFVLVSQIVDTTVSETRTYFSTNLSNVRPKYNKIVLENVSAGRDNSAFTVKLNLPEKEPALK